MPRVHSVDDITTIISGIIANAHQLQNIVIKGVVTLVDGQGRCFLLNDDKNQISCFIPKSSHISLPEEGESIIAVGNFSLNPVNSRYQIKVSNILEDEIEMNISSVEDISNELTDIISGMQELQNIRIQGEVSQLFIDHKVSYWNLRNQKLALPIFSIIQCKGVGSTDSLVHIGHKICVQGKISIFPQKSKYQIEVSHLEDIATIKAIECQCIGCEYCQKQETNQTCSPPENLEYELCAECYNESPDREDRIANAVYAYFYALGGNGFSPEKEREIQIGLDNRKADVVLVDGNGSFAAVAECKGAGFVGHGKRQMKSYLSASNSPFGIFANRADPRKWKFYKNLGKNKFDEVKYDQFKEGIKELTGCALQSVHSQIQKLESEKKQLEKTKQDMKDQLKKMKNIFQNVKQTVDKASEEIDE